MSTAQHTPGRCHAPIDRAVIAVNALCALGVQPTVARLMRMVRPLGRSEALAAIAKATGSAA